MAVPYAPDMDDELTQDDGDGHSTPRRAPETPVTAAPLHEPTLEPDSVFEPSDFIEFLVATDALLDPNDPKSTPASSSFVEKLLAPALRTDPAALAKFSKEEHFPSRWSFWLDVTRPHGMSTKAFKRGLHVLGHLSNINSFCYEWNELLRGDTFAMYSNLRLFKEGIRPLWEEPANKEGGKWVLVFPVDFASEEDCGASMSIRTFGIMVTLWNRDAKNTAMIEFMKERLQELLMTSEEVRYQDHQGTIQQNEAKRKARTEMQQPMAKHSKDEGTKGPQKDKKKPKALDVAALGSGPTHSVEPAPPKAIVVPPPPEKNPWNKVPAPPPANLTPAAIPVPAKPKENPWTRNAPHLQTQAQPQSQSSNTTQAVAEKDNKQEKEGKDKGVTVAPTAGAKSKATVWGSPLKNYSWADDDATEIITDKGKFILPKEDDKNKNKEEKSERDKDVKEKKEKSEGGKKDQSKEKKEKLPEKLAKIPHVGPVKVSPPPISKFGDRVDEDGRVLSTEEFFYRQRHAQKRSPKVESKFPSKVEPSQHPAAAAAQMAKKFDDAAAKSYESEEDEVPVEPPKPVEPAEPVVGFEIKTGVKPKTKSFAELAAEMAAKKEAEAKQRAAEEARRREEEAKKREAAKALEKEKVAKEVTSKEVDVRKDEITREGTEEAKPEQKAPKTSKREAAEMARKLEAQKKEAEKAAKAAEKAAKEAEQWNGIDGTITTLTEPVAAKVDTESEESSEEESVEARHPLDGPADEDDNSNKPRKRPIKNKPKEGVSAKDKKLSKKSKKSVEERILAVEKAPVDPRMIQMLGGVAVVAALAIIFVVVFS